LLAASIVSLGASSPTFTPTSWTASDKRGKALLGQGKTSRRVIHLAPELQHSSKRDGGTEIEMRRGWAVVRIAALALPASLVACGNAAPNAPAGDASGPKGGDSINAMSRAPGCSDQPSCDDRGTSGELCRPTCDASCQKTHTHFSFWVSPFVVAHTAGIGRHQGIAILGVELSFDDRSKPGAEPQGFDWPVPPLAGLPLDIGRTMTDEDRFAPFAMCAPPKVILDLPLFDHGRTLSRDAATSANRAELEMLHHDSAAGASDDWTARTALCVGAIQDGMCDTVCGNCSYVLPAVSVDLLNAGDWSTPTDLVNGSGQCSGGVSTYGGPGMESRDDSPGTHFGNPFTHCARLGCAVEDEAPSISELWGSDTAVVSGLFGHNSNTDAEAAFRAFATCGGSRDFDTPSVCTVCGASTSPHRQDPCGDQTNTATARWDRTASLITDVVPAIDSTEGQRRPDAPRCAWADFTVSGM
jgi:hypothetical protein